MPSPSSSSPASTTAYSGILSIDALISAYKWGGAVGTSVSLSYSFPWLNGANAWFYGYKGAPYSSANEPGAAQHSALNSTQQLAASQALTAWSNVANVKFTQVTDTQSSVGDIRFAFSSALVAPVWGWASIPNSYLPNAGDIWITSSYANTNNWSLGSFNFEGLIHEIGHALGLKHPFELVPTLTKSLDNSQFTVMSYTQPTNNLWQAQTIYPSTPMVLDILAMQYLYGANYNFNAGDTTYTFDPQSPFFKTIWDGSGNDTIDIRNFSTDCRVDLTPGAYSSIRYASPANSNKDATTDTYDGVNNLGIAYGCLIENVLCGSGDNIVIGNSSNNSIVGGSSNDSFNGGGGDDTLDGGGGLDTAVYACSKSSVTIKKNATAFSVVGPEGSDTLINIERIQFSNETLALDINGNAGQAYRIYQAAFNRSPDNSGLKYWIGMMDNGTSLSAIASGFIASAEFQKFYGNNPTNQQFLAKLYDNVLHREPDSGGYAYWLSLLDSGGIDKSNTLVNFSESSENQAGVIGIIQNGIDLLN